MTIRKLALPWANSGERTYCLPTSLILTLALGEAPDSIPTRQDVRRGYAQAPNKIDGGPIDRLILHHAGRIQVTRLHGAKASMQNRGQRHTRFNAIEQSSGVARTFMLELPLGTPIGELLSDLAQLSHVVSVSPNYVCVSGSSLSTLPYAASATPSARLVQCAGSFRPAPPPPYSSATSNIHSSALAAAAASSAAAGEAADPGWAPHLMIRAPEALAYEPGDAAVLLGLIDSGVVPDHPELANRLRAGWDMVHLRSDGVAPGVKLLGEHQHRDYNPLDQFVGHGMACAGIMSGLGLQLAPGLAGDAQIIPMRALAAAQMPGGKHAVGIGSIADLDAAVKLAVDLGAKVINMSFGTDDAALAPDSPKPHADVVRYALEHGCILVAASGNNGQNTRYWPAAHEGVIAVGAVGDDYRPTRFSTRGGHVALCAPGERILSTGLTGYQHVTGTSFAAPFVAAACALLVARAARRATPLDSSTVRQLLIDSCQPFATGSADSAQGCGAGILDAAACLFLLDAQIEKMRDEERIEDG
jgi:subtilisin family serine protease